MAKYTILLVDDLLLTGDTLEEIDCIEDQLKAQFETTELGRSKLFLGAEFVFDESGTWMHMHHYIGKLFQKFGMSECSALRIPMNPGQVLKKDMHAPLTDQKLNRSIVSSLLFATNLRPYIRFVVNVVSRYLKNPQEPHMIAAKNILRYLQGTKHFNLHFPSKGEDLLVPFADADYVRDLDTRRSTFGIVHKFGETSTIDWS
jgi:hypothetical protein